MSSASPAFFVAARSNQSYFGDASTNDLVIGVNSASQRILMGISDGGTSALQISESNVTINGMFQSNMLIVGGEIIGTGSTVVFSPISPGFHIIDDDEGTGIGIGTERIQLTAGFLQWADVTPITAAAGQTFPNGGSSVTYMAFPYANVAATEQSFSKNAISFTGKYISQDFALVNDGVSIVLTGPSGMFCIGFDFISSNITKFDESIVFRVYYNKSTTTTYLQNYYSLSGSQFINVMLPSYTTLMIQFLTQDNQDASTFVLDPNCVFRMTRMSVIEM